MLLSLKKEDAHFSNPVLIGGVVLTVLVGKVERFFLINIEYLTWE